MYITIYFCLLLRTLPVEDVMANSLSKGELVTLCMNVAIQCRVGRFAFLFQAHGCGSSLGIVPPTTPGLALPSHQQLRTSSPRRIGMHAPDRGIGRVWHECIASPVSCLVLYLFPCTPLVTECQLC